MIRRHKRTSIAILSTITLAIVFLFAFHLLQPDSEAHDMCKSQRAAVANAQNAVARAKSTYNSAAQSLKSAKRSLANAQAALKACEKKHKDIHDDPG